MVGQVQACDGPIALSGSIPVGCAEVIGSLQVFVEAYVMTEGGPLQSTLFYNLYLYQKAFDDFEMGYASAMAWILLVITLVATWIQLRVSKKWVHYG